MTIRHGRMQMVNPAGRDWPSPKQLVREVSLLQHFMSHVFCLTHLQCAAGDPFQHSPKPMQEPGAI